MCTRILNNIDKKNVTVGRCMDWEFDLPSYVYARPVDTENTFVGVGRDVQEEMNLDDENLLKWRVKYSSMSTQIGEGPSYSSAEGTFGTDDGMNEAGLVMNILYDANVSYGGIPTSGSFKALSTLRWGQFVLDSFASVAEVVEYFQSHSVVLIEEPVPGDDDSTAMIHMAVADKSGDSAILEVREGKFYVYHSADHAVTTNEPSYETQCAIASYWFYQWNLLPTPNPHPVYTVPGGNSSVQRFERACFYRYMYLENDLRERQTPIDRLLQVRTMINTCTVPLRFNCKPDHSDEPSSYTLWVNLADINNGLYYFLSAQSIGGVWFNTSAITESRRICVSGAKSSSQAVGLANADMAPCDMLFMD